MAVSWLGPILQPKFGIKWLVGLWSVRPHFGLVTGATGVGMIRAEGTLQMLGGGTEGGVCLIKFALRSQGASKSQVRATLCA